MAKILLVEDEPALAQVVSDWLSNEDHEVQTAGDGSAALSMLGSSRFDIVLLDVVLPKIDGLEVCKTYRKQGGCAPVLMVTGEHSIDSKAAGFDSGADDYLTKPFTLRELSLRISALLRRMNRDRDSVLSVADLELEPATRNVRKSGRPVHLLPREFSLLRHFMNHPEVVFSSEELVNEVWGENCDILCDTVRSHIKTLRRKIDTPGKPSLIVTVHAVGYKLQAP